MIDGAEKADSYSFENEDGDSVDVADVEFEDNVATVTLKDNVDNQTTGILTVNSDVTGSKEELEVEFFDTTIPEVNDVSVAGKDTVKFSFSEPLNVDNDTNLKDAFEIGGGDYYIKSAEAVNNGTEINVTTYADLEEGDLDVAIDNSLEDYAGYNVTSTSKTLDVEVDEDAPEITGYKNASPRQVTLVYNEDVQLTDDADESNFYHTNDNNQASNVEVDGNEVTLTFNDSNLPEGTAYVYVSGDSIVDLWGNAQENQTRHQVDVEVDETKPTLEDLEVKDDQTLELTMSEDVDVDDADLTLLDENGDEVDKAINDVSVDGKTVTVTTYDKLTGDHSLVVDGIEDIAGNTIDKVTKDFNVEDTNAPNVDENEDNPASAKLYDANTDQLRLVVNYPEQMAVEGQYSVTDLSKYSLAGNDLSNVDGASIDVQNDGSTVEIMLPKDNINDVDTDNLGDNDLEVGRVADSAGNYTSSFSNDVSLSGEGYVEIATDEDSDEQVYATDNETIEVELDDRLDNFEKEDFTFEKDGEEINPEKVDLSLNDSGNTVITFKFAKDHQIDSDVENWTVSVNDADSANKYGETLDDVDQANVIDKIKPSVVTDDNGDKDFTQAYNSNGNTVVTVDFDEKLTSKSDNYAENDFNVVADGNTLKSSEFEVSTVEDSDKNDDTTLQFEFTEADYDQVDIETASTINYVTDDSNQNNTINPFDVSVDLDNSAPALDSANLTVADDDFSVDATVDNDENAVTYTLPVDNPEDLGNFTLNVNFDENVGSVTNAGGATTEGKTIELESNDSYSDLLDAATTENDINRQVTVEDEFGNSQEYDVKITVADNEG